MDAVCEIKDTSPYDPYKCRVLILTCDHEFEVKVGTGPGIWCRVLDKARVVVPELTPEDFDTNIQALYYYHRPHELKDRPDAMEKHGVFLCQQCGHVYPKFEFKYHDTCDMCRVNAGQKITYEEGWQHNGCPKTGL